MMDRSSFYGAMVLDWCYISCATKSVHVTQPNATARLVDIDQEPTARTSAVQDERSHGGKTRAPPRWARTAQCVKCHIVRRQTGVKHWTQAASKLRAWCKKTLWIVDVICARTHCHKQWS